MSPLFFYSGGKWRASQTQTKTGKRRILVSASELYVQPHSSHVSVSGCMYHPAELYSGRNTWDSYAAGGPNRGQWAPLASRPWSHAQRSAAPSSKLLYTYCFTCFVQMWGIFILFSYKFILLGRVCFKKKKNKWEFKFLLFGLISESSAHGRDTD